MRGNKSLLRRKLIHQSICRKLHLLDLFSSPKPQNHHKNVITSSIAKFHKKLSTHSFTASFTLHSRTKITFIFMSHWERNFNSPGTSGDKRWEMVKTLYAELFPFGDPFRLDKTESLRQKQLLKSRFNSCVHIYRTQARFERNY